MKFSRCKFLSLVGIPLILLVSGAGSFSNNVVRVNQFKWMEVETAHFIIYYDQEDSGLIPYAARYLEEAWTEVGKTLDFQVPKKMPFFLYSDHNKFEQTNIVQVGEGTGGVTEAFKNRFLIFNDGSQSWMKHVIYHEFAHVVQFNVLYGGFWKSIRLLKSPFYPLWLMEGMAEFCSGDIDQPLADMIIRDAVAHRLLPHLPELQGFNHLKPNQVTLAYKTGEAAMEFLAEEYGQEKVGEMLKTIKDYFDVSAALNHLIGGELEGFDFRFHEWLEDKYANFFEKAKIPEEYGKPLTHPDGLPQFNHSPVFSFDGKKIYFIGDKAGPSYIYEKDLVHDKLKTILKLDWGDFENIHSKGRALSISSDGRTLAFAGEKVQKDFLYLYDLEEEKLKKVKLPFDQIRFPVFSPVDQSLVVVAMEKGINDLYLISPDGKILKRLTDSVQDEKDPVFTPDGKSIVFSGEVFDSENQSPIGYDLFKLGLEEAQIQKLTDYEGDESEPEILPDGRVVFIRNISDEGDFEFNIYSIAENEKFPKKWTQLLGGAFSPRYSPSAHKMIYEGYHKGERHIYEFKMEETEEFKVKTFGEGSQTPPYRQGEAQKYQELTELMMGGKPLLDSSLFLSSAKPYRFRGSTDLFIPFFFYSSLDGLVFADIWQLSDYLGNHQIQQQLQYASGSDFTDLGLFYTYARFRPQFSLGVRNTRAFRDFDEQHQEREFQGVGLMTYPLDRVKSISLGIGAKDRRNRFLDHSEPDTRSQERFWILGFAHDTVTGRYLIPTKGNRYDFTFQNGVRDFGGRENFKSGALNFVQYIPIQRESTIASRFLYGRSTGENPQVFRMGGVDRIRGVSRGAEENKKHNLVMGSMEARIRLQYLNWRTKFLFPDFFFKASYLVLFTDAGFGWDTTAEREAFETRDILNSTGVGLSWPTFILQTFQLNLTVQWAKQTNTGSEIWYITVGPTF